MLKTLPYVVMVSQNSFFLDHTLYFKLAHQNSLNLKLIFFQFRKCYKCSKLVGSAIYPPPPAIFNSLLGGWKCGQTGFFVFDILLNVLSGKCNDVVLLFCCLLSLDKRSDCCGYQAR